MSTAAPGRQGDSVTISRKRASNFDQRILEIFDRYLHGEIWKLQFITQARKYAVAGVTGAMVLERL